MIITTCHLRLTGLFGSLKAILLCQNVDTLHTYTVFNAKKRPLLTKSGPQLGKPFCFFTINMCITILIRLTFMSDCFKIIIIVSELCKTLLSFGITNHSQFIVMGIAMAEIVCSISCILLACVCVRVREWLKAVEIIYST